MFPWMLVLMLATPSDALAKKPRGKEVPEERATMNAAGLDRIIQALGTSVESNGMSWRFDLEGFGVMVFIDEHADRMRIMSPVADASSLDAAMRERLLQANFDAALDSRYAIARGQLWSVFVHPLGSLTPEDFVSGLAQTITCVATYGSTYSSGALMFNGGDSQGLHADLYERVLKRSRERMLH